MRYAKNSRLVVNRLVLCMVALFLVRGAAGQLPDDRISDAAPDSFIVHFDASTGPFEMTIYRSWSPAAVDRLYHLVRVSYFDGAPIFRVAKGFVAQFGIADNPAAYAAWKDLSVPDEPVRVSNTRGRVSFARGGPGSRTTQLFINLADNTRLDSLVSGGITGYPPIGQVTKGMEAVDALNGQYGNDPSRRQQDIAAGGRAWLETAFPGLDWIKTARFEDFPVAEQDTLAVHLTRLSSRFSAAYVARDVDTMMSLYTSDATILPGNSEPVTGQEAIRAYWTLAPGREITNHRIWSERIEHSGDMVSDYGFYEVSGVTNGEAWGPSGGKYLIVWTLGSDGQWRMSLDMWNSRAPN